MMKDNNTYPHDGIQSGEDVIRVVFTPDAGYFIPAYISVFSMLHNASGKDRIVVYMLVPGDFPADYFSLLNDLKSQFPFFTYEVINMSDRFKSVQINVPHIGATSMYRLLIPELLTDADKCIYIDSDTVVEGDIRELFDRDVQDVYLAGIKDIGVTANPEKNLWQQRNIPSLDRYINSGVLLMNLSAMREDDVCRKLEENASLDCPFNDQDVINLVCYGHISLLPFRFNAATPYIYCKHKKYSHYYGVHNEEEFTRARKDPLIVHYVGNRKPWSYRTQYGGHHWWKYVNMQDDRVKKDYILPYVAGRKGPVRARISETVTSFLAAAGMSGLYRLMKKVTSLAKK